jgi:hypothetical protein
VFAVPRSIAMSPTDRREARDQRLRRCDRNTPRESTLTSIRARQEGSLMPDASTFLLFAAASAPARHK